MLIQQKVRVQGLCVERAQDARGRCQHQIWHEVKYLSDQCSGAPLCPHFPSQPCSDLRPLFDVAAAVEGPRDAVVVAHDAAERLSGLGDKAEIGLSRVGCEGPVGLGLVPRVGRDGAKGNSVRMVVGVERGRWQTGRTKQWRGEGPLPNSSKAYARATLANANTSFPRLNLAVQGPCSTAQSLEVLLT